MREPATREWGLTAPELSVVVPVHNEVGNVGPLNAEIRAALCDRVDFEIVFVDDGSDDGTAEFLAQLASELPRLMIVRLPKRAGQSAAIAAGVRAARARWVATLDGDGQNDPADILPMLQRLSEPSALSASPPLGLITGFRRQRRDRWDKRIAGRIANSLRSRVLGDGTPDTGCGLKLFDRAAFLALPQFDHMHRYLPALFLRGGWRVVSVPVNHRVRGSGRSHYGVFDRLWVALIDLPGVWWLLHRPLGSTIVENSDEP